MRAPNNQLCLLLFFLCIGSCRATQPTPSPLLDATNLSADEASIQHFQHTHLGTASWVRFWRGSRAWQPRTRPLLVFFHGNLGSNFGAPDLAPSRILTSSARKDLGGFGQPRPTIDQIRFEASAEGSDSWWNQFVLLAILAPTDSERPYKTGKVMTWGSQFSEQSLLPRTQLDLHADFANDVISRVLADHPEIDPSRVFFVGQSGGSLFLAGTMIPKHGAQYRGGGAIFLCGGESPLGDYADRLSPEFAKNYRLHFHTTANESEHLAPLILQAHEDYSKLWAQSPWQPQLSSVGDGKHCKFHTTSQPTLIRPILQNWIQQ